MNEKKHPVEQIASHTYKSQVSSAAQQPRRRIVTTPHEIVQPSGWTTMAQRREQHRRPQAHSQVGEPLVARTLAQTGLRASSGRMQAIRPPQRRTPPPTIPRRSGRLQKGSRTGFWRLLGIMAVLIIGILGVSFVLTSSAFRVQQVSVVGTQNRSLVREVQHMGVQGQDIFLVDTTTLTLLIGALPIVASVNVQKQWPDQLNVSIVERTPALLWQTKQGTYSVDKTGMVMAPAADTSGAEGLPTVVDARSQNIPGGKQLQPGARLNAADIGFASAVFASLPKLTNLTAFTLRYESTMYVVSSNGHRQQSEGQTTFVIASPAGWVAYLGNAADPDPLDNRLLELQQILVMAQQQQLSLATIDLRFGLRPVYTVKNNG